MAKNKDKKQKREKVEQAYDLPEYYINRELSWIAFNQRVLELAERETLPLLERMKFLAIFSSNLDEFYMIRVAGLNQQLDARIRKKGMAGRTPLQQLREISIQVHDLMHRHTLLLKELMGKLREEGLTVLSRKEWTQEQRAYFRDYFQSEVLPVLTPLGVLRLDPCPLLPGLQLNVAVTLRADEDIAEEDRLLVIPVPGIFSRFLTFPLREETYLVTIEDVIADNIKELVPGHSVQSIDTFRLTRDADVDVKEDEASDLLSVMEAAIIERRRRTAVRLEISTYSSKLLQGWLKNEYQLNSRQVYEIDGLLDARGVWQLVNYPGYDRLRIADWAIQRPIDLLGFDSVWEAVADHDVMMYHPYESFEPVVKMIQQAATDADVLAIKQTLYRTSSDSPIIAALEQAAENGKEVTVLVELKARFDEQRNVQWAKRLEDAGCHVIYGIVGLKTHAKALLIIRREKGYIKRYVHLATGNYNDTTAKLYSDVGLFTCDSQIATDVSAFFNMLTGLSESVGWSQLSIAPVHMKKRFIELIEREIQAGSQDRPGLIMAKVNSLEDKDICQALYRASCKGVRIVLNVRGICCLKPGVKGLSENIEVVSVLGRYLEHARIFYFANGGHPEVYLSSADWMSRNLDKRFELLFPVTDAGHKKRCKGILDVCFSDNTGAWKLGADGVYKPITGGKKKIEAQQVFYDKVLAARKRQYHSVQQFQPVKSKK